MTTTLSLDTLRASIATRNLDAARAAYFALTADHSPASRALRATNIIAEITTIERAGCDIHQRPDGGADLVTTPRSAGRVERAWEMAGVKVARLAA